MSLDVYLTGPKQVVECECENCGNTHTREIVETLFHGNITHNLNKMAGEAGIYKELWRPDELGITTARQLIQPFTFGLFRLRDNPSQFEPFNPKNGWGDYGILVRFVQKYLQACREHPDATLRVSR